MPINISAVVISKNEVDRIGDCIQSILPLTNDIIVMDSGSEDGTIEMAKSLGAKVFETEWKGYGPTKNLGHSKAKHEWILSIDADEVVTAKLAAELRQLDVDPQVVYAIDRQNFYLGQQIKYSGWSPDWVYRLFHKKNVQWNDSLVHEKLIISKSFKIVKLKGKLNHFSYRSKEDHRAKIEKYAALRAQIWQNTNRKPGVLKKWFGPFLKGFKSFVLKLGFLDGHAGWVIAKMNVYLVRRQLYYFDQLNQKKP